VVPIASGGKNNVKNLIPCCRKCNSSKGTKDVADWAFEKHGLMGAARALAFMSKRKLVEALYDIEITVVK
jgi:hypothetical protein